MLPAEERECAREWAIDEGREGGGKEVREDGRYTYNSSE
jgi:hypothetical protein